MTDAERAAMAGEEQLRSDIARLERAVAALTPVITDLAREIDGMGGGL